MTIDTIELEILANRFQAVVDEMAQVLFRTAHTVFVKETQDYGSVLVSPEGEVFAAPRRYGVLMMVGMPMKAAIDAAVAAAGGEVREGDVFFTNDPEATRGMVTHLSDVFLYQPIFGDGRVICWAWTFIHMSDVGGRVPGSIAPSSYEVFQEGIRVPPRHLYRAGVLDRSFLDMFLANCRIPEQNWGDMKACIAGLTAAETRVHELFARYGTPKIASAIGAVLDYAETQARRVIAHVPEGTYHFSDFVEADMVGQGLVRIALALTIRDGQMLLDFTGTAPQVRAALNIPTFGTDGHWMLITGLVNWLCTMEPGIAYNAGLVRPMKVRIPEGTILNPSPLAAFGARYATAHKVTDVTIGALAQAVPMELPATDSGQGSILLVSVPDYTTGRVRVSVVQPIIGGSGGRPMADGVDGTMVLTNFLRNVPTEMLERDMPEILIRDYALRQDSGGAGRWRGGNGIVIELETAVPHTTITSRAMERYVFPPPGRMGGQPGATGYTLVNPGTAGERDIGKIDVLELGPGDRLRIGTQGGGGFGDPLERPARDVAADVRDEFVSVEAARAGYGVVLDARGAVDEAATAALRRELRAARGSAALPAFSFGPARDAHYRRWTDEAYARLNAVLRPYPAALRPLLYPKLIATVERDRTDEPGEVSAAAIDGALRAVSAEWRLGAAYPLN